MTDYLIELYPADFFFFANDRINHPDVKDAYYTRSAYFPQQTGLLGMLRYQLLLQNGITRPGLSAIPSAQINRAAGLIGRESFRGTAAQSFGAIQKISPLFLTHRGEEASSLRFLHTIPMTEGFAFEKQKPPVSTAYLNGNQKGFLPWLADFKAKKGTTQGMIDQEGNRFSMAEIFLETERTGIKKSDSGVPDSGAFYRQLMRGLHKEYAFAFIATMADHFVEEGTTVTEKVQFARNTATLGAERSAFFMEVTPHPGFSFTDTLPDKIKTAPGQVTCLSDTLLPEALAPELVDFLAGDTFLFNNLKTSINEPNFYAKPGLNQAARYLLQRGSVFFTSNKEDLLGKLSAETAWTNIGFNHCI